MDVTFPQLQGVIWALLGAGFLASLTMIAVSYVPDLPSKPVERMAVVTSDQLYQAMLDAFAVVKADSDKIIVDRQLALDALNAWLKSATPLTPP